MMKRSKDPGRCTEPPGSEKPPSGPDGGSGSTCELMMDDAAADLEAGCLNCGGSARSADSQGGRLMFVSQQTTCEIRLHSASAAE